MELSIFCTFQCMFYWVHTYSPFLFAYNEMFNWVLDCWNIEPHMYLANKKKMKLAGIGDLGWMGELVHWLRSAQTP